MTAKLIITARVLPDGDPFTVKGRDAWALSNLISAGESGCTPLSHVGPRWSAYIFNLRRNQGLVIETRHENHGGQFAGTHGKYILHSKVAVISEVKEAA